jgi:molecular chaperone HscB
MKVVSVLGLRVLTRCTKTQSIRSLSVSCKAKIGNSHINESCWKCGSKICDGCSIFCGSPTCGSIQKLDQKSCNYFCLLSVPEEFDIDYQKLESEYKNLQKLLHPDKFTMKSNEERDRSTHNSSVVNQAYQIMKSPVDRAVYLVSLNICFSKPNCFILII